MSRAMTPRQYQQYLGMLSNPNAQKWLHTIKYAEGVLKQKNPYGTAFSGKQFDNSKPHPGTVYGSPTGYRSAAHGAYQWMPDTWEEVFGENKPMTKDNQDAAALYKIAQRGVDPTQPVSRESINKLSPEWASLPKLNGLSYHGQPVKSYHELEQQFNQFKPDVPSPVVDGAPKPSTLQIQPPVKEEYWATP